MSWSTYHRQSERLAGEAEAALRHGQRDAALELFRRAAREEELALSSVGPGKPRTLGVTAVSAAALWYHAGELREAERVAHNASTIAGLPSFAATELRLLLQSIWNEAAQREAGLTFVPGQVLVSVKGGQVIQGGAPLDLIVEKVQNIQSLFYRTAEYLKSLPLRKRGLPSKAIQDHCRPWLFQSVPGSYQFVVAVQKPAQEEMFPDEQLEPDHLTAKFLEILRAAADDPEERMPEVVTREDYRITFLKLARNLAPTGKTFGQLDVRGVGTMTPISLSPNSRKLISDTLKGPTTPSGEQIDRPNSIVLRGVLRALNLNEDWLELSVEGGTQKVKGVGETVDDLIGPMVNHEVIVRASPGPRDSLTFIDIEQDV